jgi:hypothetical protein
VHIVIWNGVDVLIRTEHWKMWNLECCQSHYQLWPSIRLPILAWDHSRSTSMIRTLLATDPNLVDGASLGEQERAKRILWNILPVSARAMGFLNDARLAGSPEPMALTKITIPTMAISLKGDRFSRAAMVPRL